MDPNSILDLGRTPAITDLEKRRDWPGTTENAAAAPAPGDVRFPGEDGGKSLAGMAQKDLTATLQLLAEQAQYITGASGAAIALRDRGEMVCRASAGSSAPEVGSLLQVNSGLSGESVRTRQTLRCDDAATDPRVNRESCEALGIASVVVMPLVQSDEVIGVFELFSDKAHVFEGRDITALERMGAMVFTSLETAMAAHGLTIWPDRTNGGARMPASGASTALEASANSEPGAPTETAPTSDTIDQAHSGIIEPPTSNAAPVNSGELSTIPGTVSGIAFHGAVQTVGSSPLTPSSGGLPQDEDEILGDGLEVRAHSLTEPAIPRENLPADSARGAVDAEDSILEDEKSSSPTSPRGSDSGEPSTSTEPGDSDAPVRSGVASLNKCGACGFPISEGRRLCLDCEKQQAQAGDAMASAPVDLGGVESESEQTSMAQESVVGDGPRFLSDDQQESSWLASHKYMLVAIIIAIVIILALFVAR